MNSKIDDCEDCLRGDYHGHMCDGLTCRHREGRDLTASGDAYPVDFDALHTGEQDFRKGAPWRSDPAAIAGYGAGFKAGWEARDSVLRL
jgi:hypothetical protein